MLGHCQRKTFLSHDNANTNDKLEQPKKEKQSYDTSLSYLTRGCYEYCCTMLQPAAGATSGNQWKPLMSALRAIVVADTLLRELSRAMCANINRTVVIRCEIHSSERAVGWVELPYQ